MESETYGTEADSRQSDFEIRDSASGKVKINKSAKSDAGNKSVKSGNKSVKSDTDDDMNTTAGAFEYKNQFIKRHLGEVDFIPLNEEELRQYNNTRKIKNEDEKNKIYDEQGEWEAENVQGRVRCTAEQDNKDDDHILYEKPEDDSNARIQRIAKFQTAADVRVMEKDDYENFTPALMKGEVIIATLDCSQISDMPSTTDSSYIKGNITVSLVHNTNTNKHRLFFSVAEGAESVNFKESFGEAMTATTCVCCFVKVKQLNGEYSNNAETSSLSVKYDQTQVFMAQFFTLPVETCVIDSMTYRSSIDEFSAKTGRSGQSKGCLDGCEQNTCCFQLECLCPCCADCKIPMCCGMAQTVGNRKVTFEASDEYHLGSVVEMKPFLDAPAHDASGMQFQVTANNVDNVYVTIHYFSLMNNRTYTCKMKLRNPLEGSTDGDITKDSLKKLYNSAKLFVSSLLAPERVVHSNTGVNLDRSGNFSSPIQSCRPMDRSGNVPPAHHNNLIPTPAALFACLGAGAVGAGAGAGGSMGEGSCMKPVCEFFCRVCVGPAVKRCWNQTVSMSCPCLACCLKI